MALPLAPPQTGVISESYPAPTHAILLGYFAIAQPLIDELQATEIKTLKQSGNGTIVLGQGATRTAVSLCDGRSATQRAADTGIKNTVLFDLQADYQGCDTITLSVADQSCKESFQLAAGLFQLLGKQVCLIPDVAGMITMRATLLKINGLAELVGKGLEAELVDSNYAAAANSLLKPLRLADEFGLDFVVSAIEAINAESAGEQYVLNPQIRRYIAADRGFHPVDLIAKAKQIARDKL